MKTTPLLLSVLALTAFAEEGKPNKALPLPTVLNIATRKLSSSEELRELASNKAPLRRVILKSRRMQVRVSVSMFR